ncbi:MAG: ABC transporter ATP-binding protein [Anaerolineales bacterium]|nr:ABC transporter ATP-binding protein [Anaerolineales bacterium]MCB9127134.1 ABC transporter ATP-binding protein [Ardenticatenales bacterium]
MSNGQPLIRLEQLGKRYGVHHALRGVSLSLHEGEIVALLGPNGAGKSTLLSLLAALSRPSSGTLLIKGQSLSSAWNAVRRHIGFVSHQSLLYPELSAAENLQFYARLYGLEDGDARARQVMAWVDLLPRYHDQVRGYSRGMVQRLTIARALLHDPQILLLDEPFSGLDEAAAERLQRLLQRIHDEAPARLTLISSHDLPRTLALVDRVLILKQGRLVVDAAASAHDPAGWRTRYLAEIGG